MGAVFSADGRYLAVTDPFYIDPKAATPEKNEKKGLITVLDTATGRELRSLPGETYRTGFSPIAPILALPQENGEIQLVNVTSGEIVRTLKGHEGNIRAVAFGPNGLQLASGGEDNTVRLWDVNTGTGSVLAKYTAPVRAVAFLDRRVSSSGRGGAGRKKDRAF